MFNLSLHKLKFGVFFSKSVSGHGKLPDDQIFPLQSKFAWYYPSHHPHPKSLKQLKIIIKISSINAAIFIIHPKGWPQLKKIPKSRPHPPLFEKRPYLQKRRYFLPHSNYKVSFFLKFQPPPYFTRKPNLTHF